MSHDIMQQLLHKINHVVVTADSGRHCFEAISADPSTAGSFLIMETTPALQKAIVGVRDDNVIRPGLRGEIKHLILARTKPQPNKKSKLPYVVGFDLIPQRYHAGTSGSTDALNARREGMSVEWREDINGYCIDSAPLGMALRDLLALLKELHSLRESEGGVPASHVLANGHKLTRKDDVTLLIKDPKPFVMRDV